MFRTLAQKGRPVDGELVIDAHTHIGASNLYALPFSGLDDVVAHMDRLGIDQACTFGFAGVNSDFEYGNDVVIEAVQQFPRRFIGFTTLHAQYPDEMIPELERCRARGLRGIKLIPAYQRCPTEDERFRPAYEYAHDNRLMMLNHHWGPPGRLNELAGRYANACFINGHIRHDCGEVLRERPNVYQCTCAALMWRDVERLVQAAPLEKIVYGSDLIDLDGAFGLGPILYARISDEAKRAILGLNMRRVLDEYA
ncbi:MAG: amidohydrolase family protein [Armatimonadota bacterium]